MLGLNETANEPNDSDVDRGLSPNYWDPWTNDQTRPAICDVCHCPSMHQVMCTKTEMYEEKWLGLGLVLPPTAKELSLTYNDFTAVTVKFGRTLGTELQGTGWVLLSMIACMAAPFLSFACDASRRGASLAQGTY
jgi:hypothetical protein